MYKLALAFSLSVIVGCATPQYQPPRLVTADIRAEYDRQNAERKEEFRHSLMDMSTPSRHLENLSWPLRVAIAKYSEDSQIKAQFGFSSISAGQADTEAEPYKKEAYYEVFDLHPTNSVRTVTFVIEGSPAQRSGLRLCDHILAINGKKFRNKDEFDNLIRQDLYLYFGPYIPPRPKRYMPVKTFTVKRGDDILEIPIRPARISKYHVYFTGNSRIGAFANGEAVYISQGMMNFVESDEELQYIIAHELSHNVEKHLEKQQGNSFLASLIGATLDHFYEAYTGVYLDLQYEGRKSGHYLYSRDFERESDYIAMYVLANAGISTDGIANIWQRFAEKDGDSGLYSATHPSYPERYISLLTINREIEEKRQKGLALRPNSKR